MVPSVRLTTCPLMPLETSSSFIRSVISRRIATIPSEMGLPLEISSSPYNISVSTQISGACPEWSFMIMMPILIMENWMEA